MIVASWSLLLLLFPALPSHSATNATTAPGSNSLQLLSESACEYNDDDSLFLLHSLFSASNTLMVQLSIPVYRLYPNPITRETASKYSLDCQRNEVFLPFLALLGKVWHPRLVPKALLYTSRRWSYFDLPPVPGWPVNSSCDQQIVTKVSIDWYDVDNILLSLWMGDRLLQDLGDTISLIPHHSSWQEWFSKEWAFYDAWDYH